MTSPDGEYRDRPVKRPFDLRPCSCCVRVLEHEGDPLTGTHANTQHTKTHVPKVKFGGQGQDVAGTRGSKWVSDGHRAAVGVQALVRNFESVELLRQLSQ